MTDTTPAKPEVNREIATTGDGMDITRGYTGPLLLPYDSVLRTRGNYDLQIYEQVFSDDEVKAAFSQRQLAVTQCEWDVEAGGEKRVDKQAAEFVREQLHKIGWDNITTKMLYGVFYGYAVAEVIYEVEGAQVGIKQIKVRNRRRFRYGKDGDLRLLTQSSMFEGIPAELPYFWNFCIGADHDDEPYGLGLAHWLYWPVLFKRNGIKFWLIFLEKFGMPTAVGKYDETSTPAERNNLLSAARALQVDSGIIMPKTMELALVEAARSGTADYKTLIDTMNATIQKVVLGQTASTQGSPGKLGGNDDLQGEVRSDLITADADLVCESFNQQIVRALVQWNFPTAAMPRVYRLTDEPEDLTASATRDKLIFDMGFKPTLAYINDTYGGDWTEKQDTPLPALPGALPGVPTAIDGAQFAEAGRTVVNLLRQHGAHFAEGATDDAPTALAVQLDTRITPTGAAWVAQIKTLVDDAATLEQVEQGLLALAPDMDMAEYATAFAEAMMVAQLAGRYDVMPAA